MPTYTPPASSGSGSGDSITKGDSEVKVVDSGTGSVQIKVDGQTIGTFSDDGLLLSDADNGDPVLTIRNTGTGANEPEIRFERTGAASQSQDIGHIKFVGQDSVGNTHLYANIFADAFDETTNTEDGRIIFEVASAGTDDVEVMRLTGSQGVVLNELGNATQDLRVESDNDTHALFVDAGVDRVAVGSDDPQGKFHVRNSNTGEYTALFENTDDGTSAAPDVALYRNSLSPANGDDLGHLIWRGTTDDGDGTVTRANITDIFSELQVATTGAESGKMHLRTKMAGTMKKRITIAATETIFNEDAQNADFRVESTGNPSMLRVDASADKVGIGLAAPATVLHINAPTSPTLRIQEGSEGGYLDIVGYADSQSQIKQVNSTTNESTMLDIDVVSTGTGLQTVRYFRNSNSGGSSSFRIHEPGTTTITFSVTGDTGDTSTIGQFRSQAGFTAAIAGGQLLNRSDHAGIYLRCAGSVTLPATSTAGEHYAILNVTGGDIDIGPGVNNINGANSAFTLATFKAATCIAIGSNNWMVVG